MYASGPTHDTAIADTRRVAFRNEPAPPSRALDAGSPLGAGARLPAPVDKGRVRFAIGEAGHWITVFAELVDFTTSCGVDGSSFEERLTYWHGVMAQLTWQDPPPLSRPAR